MICSDKESLKEVLKATENELNEIMKDESSLQEDNVKIKIVVEA